MQTRLGPLDITLAVDGVAIGLALAQGVAIAPAPAELEAALAAEIARVPPAAQPTKPGGQPPDDPRTTPVRNLLRFGSYKPTGRGKPASEYLLNAAREGRFPRINNLVDALNLVSLRHLLPISLIDLDKVEATAFTIRRGRPGESYVFNSADQTIELADLLLTAALPQDLPLGNPVKDSMRSKLGDQASRVLGVVYAPAALARTAEQAAQDLAHALATYGGATGAVHAHIVRPAV